MENKKEDVQGVGSEGVSEEGEFTSLGSYLFSCISALVGKASNAWDAFNKLQFLPGAHAEESADDADPWSPH